MHFGMSEVGVMSDDKEGGMRCGREVKLSGEDGSFIGSCIALYVI